MPPAAAAKSRMTGGCFNLRLMKGSRTFNRRAPRFIKSVKETIKLMAATSDYGKQISETRQYWQAKAGITSLLEQPIRVVKVTDTEVITFVTHSLPSCTSRLDVQEPTGAGSACNGVYWGSTCFPEFFRPRYLFWWLNYRRQPNWPRRREFILSFTVRINIVFGIICG